MTPMKPPADLRQATDDAAATIIQLTEEANEIELKFGQASKLVHKKREQIGALRRFYKLSLSYQDAMGDLIRLMAINQQSAHIQAFAADLRIPFGKAAQIMDLDITPERVQQIETIDALIAKVRKSAML